MSTSDDIGVGRRAMNLLTKRGAWAPPPLDPRTPRAVSFSARGFEIKGQQGGGATAFEVHYQGQLCVQGRARINWLTEDSSFEFSVTQMPEAARAELFDLYAAELPDGRKI